MKTRWLSVLILGALAPGGLSAAETVNSAAGLAFPSVQEGASARAIGLGSTYVGIAEGSASLLWNPAGLGNLECSEIALHHKMGLLGAFQETAVIGVPLGRGNGLGLSLNYGDNGVFEGRDNLGNLTGEYSARAYGASLGWGIQGPQGLSAGLAVKLNQQDLAGSSTSAFAGDLGVLWALNDSISIGAAYNNFGPDVSGHPLAQGLRIGVSSYVGKGSDFQWLLAISGESLKDSDSSLHFGVEALLSQMLALRAGYATDLPRPTEVDGLNGWSFGGGIQHKNLSLDYAFLPLGSIGNTQRISLSFAFGCLSPAPSPTPTRTVVAVVKPIATPTPTPAPTQPPKAEPVVVATPDPSTSTYTVKKGDTLWDISNKDRVMGDSFQWPLLYDGNRRLINDPDMIYPKQKLTYQDDYTSTQVEDAQQTAKDTPAK